MKTVILDYDPAENILSMSYPPGTHLDTVEELVAHFDRIVAFWKRNCLGRKVFHLVNYDNLNVNARLTEEYGRQIQRMLDISVGNFRYGGGALQRASARLASMKAHTPSQIYNSRQDALDGIQALKKELNVKKPNR